MFLNRENPPISVERVLVHQSWIGYIPIQGRDPNVWMRRLWKGNAFGREESKKGRRGDCKKEQKEET